MLVQPIKVVDRRSKLSVARPGYWLTITIIRCQKETIETHCLVVDIIERLSMPYCRLWHPELPANCKVIVGIRNPFKPVLISLNPFAGYRQHTAFR